MTPQTPAPATTGEPTAGAGSLGLAHFHGRCPTCEFHVVTQGCHCQASESGDYSLFLATIRKVARDDGTVHACDVRPILRGRIERHRLSSFWRKARGERLLVEAGTERSNDVAGKNAGRHEPYYTYTARSDAA